MTGDRHAVNRSDFVARRRLIALALSAAAMGSLSSCVATRKQKPDPGKAVEPSRGPQTFLLVHGAWHGGWCWDLVRARLEKLGHRVISPTLPGLGPRAAELNASTGLQTHIDDVIALIERDKLNNFVLVGHSYGGMVITGIADRMKERIKHIVYLDAALPKDGQSMISYGPPKTDMEIKEISAQLRRLAPGGLAMAVFPPELLGIPRDHPQYEWVKSQLTPHPLKSWLDEISLSNGGETGMDRTYIHCTDPVLPRTNFPYIANQTRNHPEWQYHELKTGHDAMITAPDEVSDLLENVLIS